MAYPLGTESLAERLTRRISARNLALFIAQSLEALALLHQHRIVHCDIKPENFIIFPGPSLRLADFGIARLAIRTLHASGSGTLGHMAPEQAMGKPSSRSAMRMPFSWWPTGWEGRDLAVKPLLPSSTICAGTSRSKRSASWRPSPGSA